METEEEKLRKEAEAKALQEKNYAENFLNANISNPIPEDKPTAWDSIKQKLNSNKGNILAGAAGLGLGAAAGDVISDAAHADNIEDLATGKEALVQQQEKFKDLGLDKLKPDEHHAYTSNVNSTNEDISKLLNKVNGTVSTGDNIGDVLETKEKMANALFDVQDNGKTIHSTLTPELQERLKDSGVVKGVSDGKAFQFTGDEHEELQDNLDDIVDRREIAVEQQMNVKGNQQTIANTNAAYVNAEKLNHANAMQNIRQTNLDTQADIDSKDSTKTLLNIGGAAAGAAGLVKAKNSIDNWNAGKTGEQLGNAANKASENAGYKSAETFNKAQSYGAAKAAAAGEVAQEAYANANKKYDLTPPEHNDPRSAPVDDGLSNTDRGNIYQDNLKKERALKEYSNLVKPASDLSFNKTSSPVSQGEFNRRNNIPDTPDTQSIQSNKALDLDQDIKIPGDRRFNVTSHPIR